MTVEILMMMIVGLEVFLVSVFTKWIQKNTASPMALHLLYLVIVLILLRRLSNANTRWRYNNHKDLEA